MEGKEGKGKGRTGRRGLTARNINRGHGPGFK